MPMIAHKDGPGVLWNFQGDSNHLAGIEENEEKPQNHIYP
jgi:hypothetical protein